jgi:hypothetical protein
MEQDSTPNSSPEMANASSSTSSTNSIRWLDDLERDFDKSFVEVDVLLGEVDTDQADLSYDARQKLTAISSCFAQLVCKCQTLFHKNIKLEVCLRF